MQQEEKNERGHEETENNKGVVDFKLIWKFQINLF